MDSAAIIGTGLIGASFGLALKEAGFAGRILGVSSPGALQGALACGAVDETAELLDAVRRADLVYLAQPISRIVRTLELIGPHARAGALITDAGSTKVEICAAARRHVTKARFLGGHPMAGKAVRGAAAAEAGLFRGRTYVLTPEQPAGEAEREFRGWVERIGAVPVEMTPAEHDRVVALTSHLPQLSSTALASMLAGTLGEEQLQISGPGLADMTRLAASAWEIWDDILRTNTGPVAAALDAYIARLQAIRARLPDAGADFEAGKDVPAKLRSLGRGV